MFGITGFYIFLNKKNCKATVLVDFISINCNLEVYINLGGPTNSKTAHNENQWSMLFPDLRQNYRAIVLQLLP